MTESENKSVGRKSLAQQILELNKAGSSKDDNAKRWDYVSPGLKRVRPDSLFPHMRVGNTNSNNWQYLRREVPHNWYVDERYPVMGFLSRDEAAIVHNLALLFKGKPALEVGCWRAWSSAHILKAGAHLDIIDPVLEEAETLAEIEAVVAGCKATKTTTLNAGVSQDWVAKLAADGRRWNFIFIDGDHEFPTPTQDAELCAQYAADDCIIVFHDLASPATAQGLEAMRRLGWNTMIYQTMQIMGVAWRGKTKPVEHTPDPKVAWHLPQHLRSYRLAHESDAEFAKRKDELLLELLDTETRYNSAIDTIGLLSDAKNVWEQSSKDWQRSANSMKENASSWRKNLDTLKDKIDFLSQERDDQAIETKHWHDEAGRAAAEVKSLNEKFLAAENELRHWKSEARISGQQVAELQQEMDDLRTRYRAKESAWNSFKDSLPRNFLDKLKFVFRSQRYG
ncbi:MAG: class I SAM-dependent methyltransferase [Pseudomonadota bacterium]